MSVCPRGQKTVSHEKNETGKYVLETNCGVQANGRPAALIVKENGQKKGPGRGKEHKVVSKGPKLPNPSSPQIVEGVCVRNSPLDESKSLG